MVNNIVITDECQYRINANSTGVGVSIKGLINHGRALPWKHKKDHGRIQIINDIPITGTAFFVFI